MVKGSKIVSAMLIAGAFAWVGCGSDEGVSGGQIIDADSASGGDVLLEDTQLPDSWQGEDTAFGDVYSGDGWNPWDGWNPGDSWNPGDAWNPGDSWEPFGCVSDSQCNSTPCSKGVCDMGTHQCVPYNAPDYTFCPGMGGACGIDGYCMGGVCQTKGMICDDGNPCTQDSCDPNFGCVYVAVPGCGGCGSDAQCNDGNFCTNDYCKGGLCYYADIPNCNVTGCKSDAECNDGIKCSMDQCQMGSNGVGSCVHYGDVTMGGVCCDPLMDIMSCNDGNDCTYDSCGMDYQCSYLQIPDCGMTFCKGAKECYDGNACTMDMCVNGTCQYGGVACGSPDPCVAAACDPMTGQCVYNTIPGCGGTGCKIDSQCDDGNFCTVDACAISSSGTGKCIHKVDPMVAPGLCCDPVSSSIPPCNDGDACTQDMCGPDYQCQFMGIPGCINKCKADSDCAGGDVCTIAKCDVASGVCLYGSIPNCCNPAWCDDGNPCTKDGCDAATGGCTWTPIPGCIKPCDPAMCNDYNPCTSDGCDPGGNCYSVPIPNCVVQYCKSDMECQDADSCTKDFCDYSTYTCQHYAIPDCGVNFCKSTAECNDFDACTGDLCLNNQCAHKPVTCDDGNPCTADQCLAMTGGCSNAPIPGCTATKCKSVLECDDKNLCSIDSCTAGWCNHAYVPGCISFP